MSNTLKSYEVLDDGGFKKNYSEKLINIKKLDYKEEKLSLTEGHVILPIIRGGTSKSVMNVLPCGGISKKK